MTKDDYDLNKALRDVGILANKTTEGRNNSSKMIGSDQSTVTSIGDLTLTINNNYSARDNQPQTSNVTGLEVDAIIQNVQLQYSKSHQEFQKEIRESIGVLTKELNKKMSKWGWLPFIGVLATGLVYFLNRYDKLQDKETEIIIEQKELNYRIDSIEEDILDIIELISSEKDVTTPPADITAKKQ